MTETLKAEIEKIRTRSKLPICDNICEYVKERHIKVSEEFIEYYIDDLNWEAIVSYQNLSEAFIEKHIEKHNADERAWQIISFNQKLSESFIKKFQDKLYWKHIIVNQKLSTPFIDKFVSGEFGEFGNYDRKWFNICQHQKLSEQFIEKYKDSIDWIAISKHHTLSEKFIEQHIGYVYWEHICQFQQLSEQFIEKHKNCIDWFIISENQILSKQFIERYKNELCVETQLLNNHDDRTKKQKLKEMIVYANTYDLIIKDNFLYAYRDHDVFGRGMFNKTITYEKGKSYKDWHCNLNERSTMSFGLGIWPEGNTPIKVHVDDWGCEVSYNDHGKGRVFGFTILDD